MPVHRTNTQGRRLTTASLITLSAASLLMMAWAIFPAAAFASPQQTTWNKVNGAQNVPCNGKTHWILTGFGNDANFVSNVSLNVNGDSGPMVPGGNNFDRFVNGPNTTAANTSAVASWTWDDSHGAPPTPILTISGCSGTTTSTTTGTTTHTTTQTTTQTTTTGTTTTGTTTTGTTSTGTTSSTTPGGSTTSTTETDTTTTDTVSPTTITPTSTTPDQVSPTTVTPGGTAFTGIENVVPLGAIALFLATGGTGLLWAGARRRRDDSEDEE